MEIYTNILKKSLESQTMCSVVRFPAEAPEQTTHEGGKVKLPLQ